MGFYETLLWMSLPFSIVLLIALISPRNKRAVVEVWTDERAVWKRLGGKTIELIFWQDVQSVGVSQRENAFGRIERTYLLTSSDGVEHEFTASSVREDFIQRLQALPGFEWQGFCDVIDASYPRTVICWKSSV